MNLFEEEFKKNLFKTKYDLVLEVIEGAVPLIDGKVPPSLARIAREEYLDILENLDTIPDLNEEQRTKLRSIIEEKIKNLPNKEMESEEEREWEDKEKTREQEKEEAYKKSLERWEKLSFWEKRKYKKKNMDPKELGKFNYNTSTPEYQTLGIRTINSLYQKGGGDHDR